MATELSDEEVKNRTEQEKENNHKKKEEEEEEEKNRNHRTSWVVRFGDPMFARETLLHQTKH